MKLLTIRRDCNAKEAFHIVLGITPDCQKEGLDYRLFTSQSFVNNREMFKDHKALRVEEGFYTSGMD